MKRFWQALLIVTFILFCWLGMQAVHELGHVIMARYTGAEVIKVALHPLVFSHTHVAENPHPLAVVWGGPVLGSVLPLVAFLIAWACNMRAVYLLRFFAGFCLVANGIYIGVGWLLANGADPWVMTENGSPKLLLVLFGIVTVPIGFYLWHREGRHFGFDEAKGAVSKPVALISTGLLITLVGVELIFNSK
jgi:hypothetical protein